jgi:HSP20 family molecular chaperone IbpA
MQRRTYEQMIEQVRSIYHVLTGGELPAAGTGPPLPPGMQAVELVARRFGELELMARAVPQVAARVPPFTFFPPVDVFDLDEAFLIEVAVPGVRVEDVHVDLNGDVLVVSGLRGNGGNGSAGSARRPMHAEIARGPFRRVLLLPHAMSGPPQIELKEGIITIRLAKLPTATVAQA